MDKAALGTKRVCPSCGVRFYDLGKLPIVCPKCGHSFDPETMFKGRRNRSDDEGKPQTKNHAKADQDSDENEEAMDDEESEEAGLDENGESDDHDEPQHDDAVEADDVTIDGIDDDDDDDSNSSDDDTLLEPDDDDDDDVSGIIDADIDKDEG